MRGRPDFGLALTLNIRMLCLLIRRCWQTERGSVWFVPDDPYVVVVPLDRAVEPDELYVEPTGNSSATRYGTTDPRWREDFDLKLQLSSAPPSSLITVQKMLLLSLRL